jgi:hypothetical protein
MNETKEFKASYKTLGTVSENIIVKTFKKYPINNESTDTFKENDIVNINFPDLKNTLIDQNASYIEFDMDFKTDCISADVLTRTTKIKIFFRHVMDVIKSAQIYHRSGDLIYEDRYINMHWLHDIIGKTNKSKFERIMAQGQGYCKPKKLDVNSFEYYDESTNALWMPGWLPKETAYSFLQDPNILIRMYTSVDLPIIHFKIPLTWFPFFKCISKSLLPSEIYSGMNLQLTLEKSNLFLTHGIDRCISSIEEINYYLKNFKLSLCELQIKDSVIKKISNETKTSGIKWYFHNTLSKYKNNCKNDVSISFQQPISSICYVKAIPFNNNCLYSDTIQFIAGTDFAYDGFQVSNRRLFTEKYDFTAPKVTNHFNISLNALPARKDEFESDIFFSDWHFKLRESNYPFDKVKENIEYMDIVNNSSYETYEEFLKCYNFANKSLTLPYSFFNKGFCYQACQNFQRDSSLENTGLQCDRDHILQFNATFKKKLSKNQITLPPYIKTVFVFVDHIKEIISIGDKIIVKE